MTSVKRFLMTAMLAAVCCSTALSAQEPGPGDLIPRNGTLAYMTSERPDTLYRMFGRDDKGGWKLKSWAFGLLEREHESDPDTEAARRDRAIFDWVFGSYEAIAHVEIALIDITLDGPKYLVHVRTHKGKSIDPKPEFLAEFLQESKEFKGVPYLLYRAPENERRGPGGGRDDDEPRNALGDTRLGMDRFYVASTSSGLLISNFETTIREAIGTLAGRDYRESLSSREEFAEWQKARKPHDFSIFVIGREIQNTIERLLPSEEQAGADFEGIYRGIDKWLQFREYRYIVFDFDFDDKARGITVAASFKTRRQTRLLEKLSIEPAEFKLLRYVPDGAAVTAGMQLGDAKTTYGNLKELAYDLEKWAREIQEGFGGGSVPPQPPDAWPEPVDPKSQDTGDAEDLETEESPIDRAMAEIEEMLKEYGTSLDEILSVLGSEIIFFTAPDLERAKLMERSNFSIGNVIEAGDMCLIIGLKDVNRVKAIIANARERDSQGAFRGFAAADYHGAQLNVSKEHPFGYAFTADALLVTVAGGVMSEDASAQVTAALKAMVDAGRSTRTRDTFVREGSKFVEMDLGLVTRLRNTLNEERRHQLDRYAPPPLDVDPSGELTELKLALRLKEYKDGVEFALRVNGLPDFGSFLDAAESVFGGANPDRNSYSYAEDNLRTLSDVLRRRAEEGQGLNLDEMLKGGVIRKGALQTPFDSRWQGDRGLIGWTTLDQIRRDREGKLPEWVDARAAEMIEGNEAAGFRSIVLAEGDIAAWLKEWKSGFIVAYQEKPETLGGHIVLYADGQVGWISGKVFSDALALNAAGEPVPAIDPWRGDSKPAEAIGPRPPSGPRLPDDDPWYPGPRSK